MGSEQLKLSIYCIRAGVLVKSRVLKSYLKVFKQRYLMKQKKKIFRHKSFFLYTGMVMTTPLLFYSLSGSFSHCGSYRRMKASCLGKSAFLCLELFHQVTPLKAQLFPKGDLSCFIATPFILPAAALFPCTPCRPTLLKQGKNGFYGKCIAVGLTSYYKYEKYASNFWKKDKISQKGIWTSPGVKRHKIK